MNNYNIKYYSTSLKAPEISFREALLKGIAPDGGLYMPTYIPEVSKEEMESFHSKTYPEIAFAVLNKFLGDEIENEPLMALCSDAYNFEVPLEKVSGNTFILRLDRGPTASFKDFAARMMARLMNHFVSAENKHYTILTATSGDTGSAVASAFHGLKSIDVIILFPLNEVSDIQRKQMTTLRGNIRVIAIDGKFDDCQRLVKKAFLDPDLAELSLSSANSINIGRLLPQSVYYFYGWSRLESNYAVFSVPSGNFGNLMGGIIAREMGLPLKKLIIATNDNNEVPEYLRTGIYNIISPSLNCISSAMNVGHPGNMARIVALYGGIMNEYGTIIKEPDLERMRNDFYGISVSDYITRETIASCYKNHEVLLEPHGAVAWRGLQEYYSFGKNNIKDEDYLFISLETAHPAKFQNEIFKILGFNPVFPDSLKNLTGLEEEYKIMNNDYQIFKEYIKENQ